MNSKLQDYLATYSLTGMKEKDIVEKYIIDYGLENEYATMLINLLMSKENKWANKVREIERTILSYNQGGSGAVHNKKYTIEENIMMDRWVNEFAIYGKLLPLTIEEVKKVVPDMIPPTFCYIGLIDYIVDVLGVHFKEE